MDGVGSLLLGGVLCQGTEEAELQVPRWCQHSRRGGAVLQHLCSPRGAGAVGNSLALAGAGRAEQHGLFAPSPGWLPGGVPGAV